VAAMPASRIPLKRCTAAVPAQAGHSPAAPMPSTKRRRDRAAPSQFRDSVPPPANKRPAVAPAPPQVDEEGDGEVYEVEVLVAEDKAASFGAVQTAVWTPDPPPPTEAELYRACRNISSGSGSVVTSVSNAAGASNNGGPEPKPVVSERKPKREGGDRKEDFYWPEDFVLGDVVWARSGKKCPAWPAVVIDPLQHAPEVVLNSCIPGALCVMFFGYSAGGHSRVTYLNFIPY
jgi:hypothetical protein